MVQHCTASAYLVVERALSPLDEDSSHCDDSSRSFCPTLRDNDIPIGSGEAGDGRIEPSTGAGQSTLKPSVPAVPSVPGLLLLWVVASSPSSGCVSIGMLENDILACNRKGAGGGGFVLVRLNRSYGLEWQ